MPVPDFSPGEILTASAMDSIGLWLVKSQTIGTGVSSVTVTGAFSANYDNYLITVSGGVANANTQLSLVLNNSSGNTYNAVGTYGNFGINSGVAYNPAATNKWVDAGLVGSTTYSVTIYLSSPFASRPTSGYTEAVSNASYYKFSLLDTSSNSSTGFTFTPAGGGTTLTGGTICVYGYRK